MKNSLFYLLFGLFPIIAVQAPNMLMIMLLGMTINLLCMQISFSKPKSYFIGFWGIFILNVIGSNFYAYNIKTTALESIKFVIPILCCFFSIQCAFNHKLEQNKLIKSFLFGWGIALLLLSIEVITKGAFKMEMSKIMHIKLSSSPVEFLNKSACVISIGIWCIMLAMKQLDCKYRTIYIAGIYITVLMLICNTQSESAIVGLLCSTIIFLITSKWAKFYKTLSIILGLGLCAIPVFIYLYMNNYISLFQGDIPYSWDHRIYIAFNTLYLITQKPFFGWGFGASKSLDALNQGGVSIEEAAGAMHDIFNHHPHNSSLQVMLELGAVGLLIYSLACAATIWFIGKHAQIDITTKPYIYAAFISYMVIGLFNFNVWASWSIAFIFINCIAMAIFSNNKIKQLQQ